MNNVSPMISNINVFISNKNNLDDDTIDFLMTLKESLLSLQDQSFLTREKKEKKLSEVELLLRSVGKEAFIRCYKYFKEKHLGKKKNIVSDMERCAGAKSVNSARTKASVGSKIFKKDLHIDALRNIIASNRVNDDVIEKAKDILKEEGITL